MSLSVCGGGSPPDMTNAAQPANIAGAEEVVRCDRLVRRLRIAEVGEKARWRLDLELAGDAGLDEFAGLGVADADDHLRRHRPAATFNPVGKRRIRGCDRKQGLQLARAIEAKEREPACLGGGSEFAPAG